MSGLVGVSASVNARFSAFTECLANLDKPQGTDVLFATGIDIGANRNLIVRAALTEDRPWAWFVDDDMVFPPDHLQRLLAHDQPVVASLYLNRKPPFYPVAYNEQTLVDDTPVWKPVSLVGAPAEGLAEIVGAGTGGMLVRTDVFRAIGTGGWFDHYQSTDDLAFCQRVIGAGVPIYLDLGATMGHISTYEVWPRYQQQQGWDASIELTTTDTIHMKLGD